MAGSRVGEFARLYDRELERLHEEVAAYPDDESLWRVSGTIVNPAGTLALHLAGCLNHYVGGLLGGSGYKRNREAEFSTRDVPKSDILRGIRSARSAVADALAKIGDFHLREEMRGVPERFEGETVSWMLIHLLGHLEYHMGQLNYHRRILVEEPAKKKAKKKSS